MILNIFSVTGWIIATISWICLLFLHYPRPNLGGEQAISYAYGLFACSIGFGFGLILMTGILIWQEGLSMPIALILTAGTVAIAVTTFFCCVLLTEPASWIQGPLRWIATGGGLIWIPAFTLVAAFFWVMPGLRELAPVWLWQWPLRFTSGISAFALAIFFLGWLAGLPGRQKAEVEAHYQEEAARHQQHLAEIAAWQLKSGILPLLALTGRFHDQAVRQAAVDRVRSVEDWEQQLIKLLESEGYYYHVYTFLDGNKVENPAFFVPALQVSIKQMAIDIQMQIHNADNLQHWTFDYLGVDKLTRVIDQEFVAHKAILVPTMWEVSHAFQTKPPARFKGVAFDADRQLSKWLAGQDKTLRK